MPKKKRSKRPATETGFTLRCDHTVEYDKLRPDVAETAYRTMLEATGQAPKTLPPGERTKDQRSAEAVKRGTKGRKKGVGKRGSGSAY